MPRRNRHGGLSVVLLLALTTDWSARSLSFLTPSTPVRRTALLGLLTSSAAGVAAARAEEQQRVVKPKDGAPLFSFELPAGLGFEAGKVDTDDAEQVAVFSRSDGFMISAGPLPSPDYVKELANGIGRGSATLINKYKLGEEQDDLEITELAEAPAMTSNLIGGRRSAGAHQWFRTLKGPSGQVLMILEMPQDKFAKEGTMMEAVLNSLRLGA